MIKFIQPHADNKPDLLFVHVGTNDLTKGVPDTIKNLKQISDYIKEKTPITT